MRRADLHVLREISERAREQGTSMVVYPVDDVERVIAWVDRQMGRPGHKLRVVEP
jgi:hypothetical protein